VRWLDDGNIEYIGRADHQVKIRGFRIELGEIEASVRELPEIADVAVVVHEALSGLQLVAYVVLHSRIDSVTPDELAARLKRELGKKLPEYMLPAHVMELEILPRLPSGKLDRSALPEPGTLSADTFRAPSTVEAKLLAEIWQEVLGVERVGETDNFFALGGDSLSSLKVMARARSSRDAKFDFKLRDLMQRPTIAGLLGLEFQTSGKAQTLVALNLPGKEGKPPLFCIHAGLGTVFDYQPLARQLEGKRAVYGLPCRMLSDPAHVDTSLDQMAADYCGMIRDLQQEGPYHLLGWSLGGTLAAKIARLLEAGGHGVAFLGLIDPFVPRTEALEPDNWSQDLADFVSVVVPGGRLADVTQRPVHETEPGESKQEIVSLLQEVISAERMRGRKEGAGHAESGSYADLGAEELAQIFIVARRLKALAAKSPLLGSLENQANCWWAATCPAEDRLALALQLNQVPQSSDVEADHFRIVRASSLLLEIEAVLAAELLPPAETATSER
jgi:thioesterase domain-containing protein/aryl carrier-like protein